MTEFERECDNAVNRYMTGAHLKSFGPEQVVGYLTAGGGQHHGGPHGAHRASGRYRPGATERKAA